jgi:hypothetical protein
MRWGMQAALAWMGVEMDLDECEARDCSHTRLAAADACAMQCVLANLIYRKYIKAREHR